jgi:hypothetical protein
MPVTSQICAPWQNAPVQRHDRYGVGRAVYGLAGMLGVALILSGGALAGGEKVRYNAADQAAARRAVLRVADLGTTSTWAGGAIKTTISASPVCANYHPAQSGLVVTGAASSSFVAKTLQLEVSSETQVLQTTQMVALDWQRSVRPSAALTCVGHALAKSAGAGATVVSAKRLSFPTLAPFTTAFRYFIDVVASGHTRYYIVDFVLAAKGRAEITLATIAFVGLSAPTAAGTATAERNLSGGEIRLVGALVARATPPKVSPLVA